MTIIGKKPIAVPKEVQIKMEGSKVSIKGPKGQLEQIFPERIKIELKDSILQVSVIGESDRKLRALQGLTRAMIANMVKGVTENFEKRLELVGVGYRAALAGKKLSLQLGFSHPIEIDPPAGILFVVAGQNKITVSGADKQLVGQVASNIKYLRPVEPYKGKGIRYEGQHVRRKAGKAAKTAGAA